ncbi:MAG: hypothetical protein PW788_09895 [Micavibrio sp.]|nr:hypothetical protein [Micavibrio sp.]
MNLENRYTPDEPTAPAAVKKSRSWFSTLVVGSENGDVHAVWRSRISWRITLTVFLTILLVQCAVVFYSTRSFQTDKLEALAETARTGVTAALSDTDTEQPITKTVARRLFSSTLIEGLTVYDLQYNKLQELGDKPDLKPTAGFSMPETVRTNDERSYEFFMPPSSIGKPYYIVARIEAATVDEVVMKQLYLTIFVLILMSCVVTGVMMMALGRWLLEPIMVLRHNLESAAKTPEKPDLLRAERETRDEIGVALLHCQRPDPPERQQPEAPAVASGR